MGVCDVAGDTNGCCDLCLYNKALVETKAGKMQYPMKTIPVERRNYPINLQTMAIPAKYSFLETIQPPKLVAAGLQYLGIKEIPGAKNNPVIMDMAVALGVQDIYKNDEMSWCALFINNMIRIAGKPPVDHGGDRYNLLRAKWLANWGGPVIRGDERLGDVLVFAREGGGHVGLYIAESKDTFHVLGGNQSNSCTISEIAKVRLISCRRYYSVAMPASAQKYFIDSTGQVTTNES